MQPWSCHNTGQDEGKSQVSSGSGSPHAALLPEFPIGTWVTPQVLPCHHEVSRRPRPGVGTKVSAEGCGQHHGTREGPEHGTFAGGCVCCGSGGCSVVPIGSSNRGLVTPQPEKVRTREGEAGMRWPGQALVSNSGLWNVPASLYTSTEQQEPPGRDGCWLSALP